MSNERMPAVWNRVVNIDAYKAVFCGGQTWSHW